MLPSPDHRRVPPASVATTGSRRRAPRSRRPACPRSRTSGGCVDSLRPARHITPEAEEPAELGDAELGGEPLDVGRSGPSPSTTSAAPGSRACNAASVRTRSSGRLIAVSRPAQPTRNVSGEAEPPRRVARCGPVAALQMREVEPVRDHVDRVRGRDAERDEIVAHLVADGDEGTRPAGEPSLDLDEQPFPARAEVAPEDVAVEGVDGRPAGAAALVSSAAVGRSSRLWPYACAGRPGAGA